MSEFLADRPAWYVIGAILAFCIVGLLAVSNQRLGALGGFSAVVERATGRTPVLGWKAFFLLGIFGGALLFTALAGGRTIPDGYGWITRAFDGDAAFLVGPILFGAGALIGYGAKTAGGCTSGNGICGTSLGSAASFAATGTFMAVAIASSFVIRAAT